MLSSIIKCRAQITNQCTEGKSRKGWQEDGTYDRASDTIVCDACYIIAMMHSPSGQGLKEELPAVIATLRRYQEDAQQ